VIATTSKLARAPCSVFTEKRRGRERETKPKNPRKRSAAIERRMRDFADEDYGRDRVMTEEALSKLTLRAIANGAPEPERIAAAILRILEQKAERLYG
jgi:hypothetical protein